MSSVTSESVHLPKNRAANEACGLGPSGSVIETALPMQGAWVRSLVRELRLPLPQGTAKINRYSKIALKKKRVAVIVTKCAELFQWVPAVA